MEKIRVAVLDDHDVFRDSLKLLLDHEPDLSVVAVAEDGVSAVQMVEEHRPDVLLIDFRLPGMSGVEATRVITSKYPSIKVIVLTLFNDDGHRTEALEAGAHHCLAKDGHFQGLLNVIRSWGRSTPALPTIGSADVRS